MITNIGDLAAEQWGLFTTTQARHVGATPQSLARYAHIGTLKRLTHGVYRFTGAPADRFDDLRVAWLSLDPTRLAGERMTDPVPTAVVSHQSAALLHDLGDLPADEFEFTTSTRKQSRRNDIRLHRLTIAPQEWTVTHGLPVISIPRTVADLAAERVDGGHLATIVRDAVEKHRTPLHQLAAALAPHAHRYDAPTGDGDALIDRFLTETGLSETLTAAVQRLRIAETASTLA